MYIQEQPPPMGAAVCFNPGAGGPPASERSSYKSSSSASTGLVRLPVSGQGHLVFRHFAGNRERAKARKRQGTEGGPRAVASPSLLVPSAFALSLFRDSLREN